MQSKHQLIIRKGIRMIRIVRIVIRIIRIVIRIIMWMVMISNKK